ncbi:MAG: hypothetical protein EKK37_15735 [Sphingobacteriales bacterium]|nr:MAG: hypothetical protein EKK37_15735 [Sphingobacteriales bacterium]
MSKAEDFGEFISENKDLLKDYFETRMEVYRLQAVKTFSKTAGLLLWTIISIFLLFLVIIFAGIVLGFWFSGMFNSNVLGFGLTTLIMIVIIALLGIFRRQLFINPIIRGIISHSQTEQENDYEPNL